MKKSHTEPKQHYISDFYFRKFTFDLTEERDKNKLRVYALNKIGKIEPKRTSSLCQIRGYHSKNEEFELFELGCVYICFDIQGILEYHV